MIQPTSKSIFYNEELQKIHSRTDWLFAVLMLAQWAIAILFALIVSPYAWAGNESTTHIHVWAAIFLGGLITIPVVYLAYFHAGRAYTRHVIAVSQAMMSGLLIHLTGGRIETHFHIFGSLAFLSFYRDWKVLITASAVIACDHMARGFFFPLSVFGELTASPFRALEHVGWVVFEDIFLVYSCHVSLQQIEAIGERQASLENLNLRIEKEIDDRTHELKEAQAHLLQTQKLDSLGKLASGIAHDFNNVLGGILAHASLLRLQSQDADMLEGIQVIESSAARGADLTKKLLAFARKGNYEKKKFQIEAVIQEAVSLVRPSFPANINIDISVAKALPGIEGDSTQLLQVLMNLMGNAKDAMPTGGNIEVGLAACDLLPSEDIQFKDVRAGHYLKLTVKDHGAGIPEDIRHRIFEPFFTTKKAGEGTGLGLSMVYGIVKTHGGAITMDSKFGDGTEFNLYFPALAESALTTGAAPATSINENLGAVFKGLHILVAEDDSVLRLAAKNILESCGATVTAVENGLEAVESFKRSPGKFAAVLLDVVMPKMDGVAAFHAVKDIQGDTVFIVVSGYAESSEIAKLRNQYSVSFLSKPYNREELARTIHSKLQAKKAA